MAERGFGSQDDIAVELLGVNHSDAGMPPFDVGRRQRLRRHRRHGVNGAGEAESGVDDATTAAAIRAAIVNRDVAAAKRDLALRGGRGRGDRRGGGGRGGKVPVLTAGNGGGGGSGGGGSGCITDCAERGSHVVDGALLYVIDGALL